MSISTSQFLFSYSLIIGHRRISTELLDDLVFLEFLLGGAVWRGLPSVADNVEDECDLSRFSTASYAWFAWFSCSRKNTIKY